MQVATTPTSFGGTLLASLTAALALFFSAIPKILGFLIILAVGWFVATVIARAVASLLRMVRFNEVAERSGFTGLTQKMGVHQDPAGTLALVAKWFVRLIVLVMAFDALGIPAVSGVLQQLLLWLPNFVVAMVILVIGGLAARALGDIVRGASAQAGFGHPDLMANIARATILTFAVVAALSELKIAPVIVNTIVIATLASVALASGLAFGLGGRDKAQQLLESWSQKGEAAGPQLHRAAQAAGEQARQQMGGERSWSDRSSNDRRRVVRS